MTQLVFKNIVPLFDHRSFHIYLYLAVEGDSLFPCWFNVLLDYHSTQRFLLYHLHLIRRFLQRYRLVFSLSFWLVPFHSISFLAILQLFSKFFIMQIVLPRCITYIRARRWLWERKEAPRPLPCCPGILFDIDRAATKAETESLCGLVIAPDVRLQTLMNHQRFGGKEGHFHGAFDGAWNMDEMKFQAYLYALVTNDGVPRLNKSWTITLLRCRAKIVVG